MADYRYFEIFPQKWTGSRCAYCGERHGIRYWKNPDLPNLRFNSKKCLLAYVRDYNKRVNEKRMRSNELHLGTTPLTRQADAKISKDGDGNDSYRGNNVVDDFKEIDFIEELYPTLLERLAANEVYHTKTGSKPNWVKVKGDKILVMTVKSRPKYIEIPISFFIETWDLLVEFGEISQNELSKTFNIKRSAFLLIAFSLLDEVQYIPSRNALKLRI